MTLRELLKEKEPSLHVALEKAWDIAINEIYPSMPSISESFNSYPHVLNLENYLNSILPVNQELFNEKSPIHLSAFELYALLVSIFLHDIGRISSDVGHGSFSKQKILKNYIKYGISTKELAIAIGDICEYHEPIDKNINKYSEILLDANKGSIRIKELGALLILVDLMDDSYRRLKPLYVIDQDEYLEDKSHFRSIIKGVIYDPSAKAIVTSLDENFINEVKCLESSYKIIDDDEFTNIEIDFTDSSIITLICNIPLNEYVKKDLNSIVNGKRATIGRVPFIIDSTKLTDELSNVLMKNKLLKDKYYPEEILIIKSIYNILNLYTFRTSHDKISNDFIAEKNKIKKEISKELPLYIILAMLLRDLRINNEKLQKEKMNLSRLGIHINEWIIYYEEHLYNYKGSEIFESVFDKEYLKNIALCMWNLSKNVFGQGIFSYKALASAAFEQDIDKIRKAVKRIDLLLKKEANDFNFASVFIYDHETWCWNSNYKNKQYVCVEYEKIKYKIENISIINKPNS